MARRISYFFQNGFSTSVDGRCYLRKVVPGGFAPAQEVTSVDEVVGWFTVASCADGAIVNQANRAGFGQVTMPGLTNGWTVVRQIGQCGTGAMLITCPLYAEKFIASINPASGRWDAVEAEAGKTDEQLCGPVQQTGKPIVDLFDEWVPNITTKNENIDWRIAAAIAILILTGLYALYLKMQ